MINYENLKITFTNCILKVKICGDIDHHNARQLREKIDAQIFSKKPRRVVLDFSSVSFMDSSGLGLIMGRYTNAAEIGASLIVYRPSPRVKKILELAGIERIIEIKGDTDHAL